MMTPLARTDTSVLARWWWTVDRWTLVALCALIAIGVLLTATASPPVADRIGLAPWHFVFRQGVFAPLALAMQPVSVEIGGASPDREACLRRPRIGLRDLRILQRRVAGGPLAFGDGLLPDLGGALAQLRG